MGDDWRDKGTDAFYLGRAASAGAPPPPNDPIFREAYAKERARLDHLAADVITFGATLVPVRDLTLSQAWRSSPMARQDQWLPV
jgi:hypothetical protein